MSKTQPTEAVKLLMSHIYAGANTLKGILEGLCERYGDIDFVSAPMTFHYTNYYTEEMGSPLERRFIFFDRLTRPESLPDVKLWTNEIENKTSEGGNRRINIDPGYMSQAHLILATGKGYSHRPYLRDGIYADLTLIYMDKSFQPLPWTYPDYREKTVTEMFKRMRSKYLMQLKG